MAFKLALSVYSSGLESQAAQALSALKLFDTLTPPVTVTDMRTELETGQFQAFSDEGWNNFLLVVAQTPLDESALTTSERAIINEIYGAVNLTPKKKCCGATIPADLDGLTEISPYFKPGTTYEYEIVVYLEDQITCDVETVEVTITGVPAVTSTNPHICTFNGCSNIRVPAMDFVYPDVTFASDPTGTSHTVAYVFKDADGVVISSYTVTDYTLDF